MDGTLIVTYKYKKSNVSNLSIDSFVANKTSPQIVKTEVTLTTKVSGVTGTAQYNFYRYLNGNYAAIREWSTTNNVTISPSTTGTYDIWVAVKDSTGTTVKKNLSFTFKTAPSISSFKADKTSPQVVGTSVKLTAGVSGTTGTVQYKFYRYLNGNYGVINEWSTTNSVTIKPSTAGTYDLWVAVKDSTGTTIKKNLSFTIK